MVDFISELFRSSWIYERLQQAIEDGFFESHEEFSYFAANVFAPMFLYFMLYTIFVFFCTICLVRFGLLLIDLLGDVIRRIYLRLRYGRVIHLYSPEKEVIQVSDIKDSMCCNYYPRNDCVCFYSCETCVHSLLIEDSTIYSPARYSCAYIDDD